jgi:hypothetical protein
LLYKVFTTSHGLLKPDNSPKSLLYVATGAQRCQREPESRNVLAMEHQPTIWLSLGDIFNTIAGIFCTPEMAPLLCLKLSYKLFGGVGLRRISASTRAGDLVHQSRATMCSNFPRTGFLEANVQLATGE